MSPQAERRIRGRLIKPLQFCRRKISVMMFAPMANKVRWGVLGAAKIAVKKVVPGMQKGELCEVAAIASRDRGKAEEAARTLGHSKGLRIV